MFYLDEDCSAMEVLKDRYGDVFLLSNDALHW